MQAAHRRKFTEEEKREIVGEANLRGVSLVLREHKLSYSVFSRWKARIQPEKVKEEKNNQLMQQQLNALIVENELLRKSIANLVLELQIKTEKLNRLKKK